PGIRGTFANTANEEKRRLRRDLDARSGAATGRYPLDSAPDVGEQLPERREPLRGNGYSPAGQADQDRPANGRKSVKPAHDRVGANAHGQILDADVADARESTRDLRPELTRRSAKAAPDEHRVCKLMDPEVLPSNSSGLKMVLH